jgi:hypothetical protein
MKSVNHPFDAAAGAEYRFAVQALGLAGFSTAMRSTVDEVRLTD